MFRWARRDHAFQKGSRKTSLSMENKADRFQHFNLFLLQAAFVGLFYFGMLDNARGPAYPGIMRDLKLSNWEGSFLFALTSLMSFTMTVLSPFWLKKLKLYQGMKLSWIILALAGLFLGLSGIFNSAPLLYLASIVQGTGMGINGMNMNLMVEAGTPVTHRRRVYGALHATYGVASFLAPLLFSGLKMAGFKWQGFFLILAFIGPLLFFLPKRKGDDVFSQAPAASNDLPIPMYYLLTLSLCVGMYVASEIVVSSRLVLFLEESHKMSNAEASTYLSGFFILLMGGRLSLGLFHIPIKGHILLISSLVLTTIFSFLGNYIPVFYSLTGLSMSVFFPSFMDWIAETFPSEFQRVTKFALSGIGIHLVMMHLGFGKLADSLGVNKAMMLVLILSLTSLGFLTFALLNRPQTTKRMPSHQ